MNTEPRTDFTRIRPMHYASRRLRKFTRKKPALIRGAGHTAPSVTGSNHSLEVFSPGTSKAR